MKTIYPTSAAMALFMTMSAAAPVSAAASATANVNATMTVVIPATIAANTGINFGQVSAPTTGTGTVTVAPSGTATYASGSVRVPGGDATTAANLTLTAVTGRAVSLLLSALSMSMTSADVGAPPNIVVDTFVFDDGVSSTLTPSSSAITTTIGASNASTIKVGATAHVPAAALGIYTAAPITLTISFN